MLLYQYCNAQTLYCIKLVMGHIDLCKSRITSFKGHDLITTRNELFQTNYSPGFLLMTSFTDPEINVYPNPASKFVILSGENVSTDDLRLTSSTGDIIPIRKHATSRIGNNVFLIDVSYVPSGSYILRSGSFQSRRLVILR